MQETRLLGEEWRGACLQLVQDTLLVVMEDEREDARLTDLFLAVAFDLRSRRPLGPMNSFGSPVHLVGLPALAPTPVLASATAETLTITDMRNGSVLKTFPLPDTGTGKRSFDGYHLAMGHHGGRDLLFLHQAGEGHHHSVSAVDLATGESLPALGFNHCRYREISECLTLRHGYLVCPTTKEVVEAWDYGFDTIDKPFVHVQRADDGSRVGEVGLHGWVPEGRAVDIVRAAGNTYLAEAEDIVTLPDLEPVFSAGDPWAVVSRVTEWDGRPVAVIVQERNRPQELPGLLYLLFLDTKTPQKIVLPWPAPPRVHDLLATPDGTIVVSSAAGVHVLDVDPSEAARTNPPK
ncbi:hypothetical protein ACOQFV_21605 [Nocardiopsis changdeensis]|uniref:Uncharacterized protein n=1 Tax=Nocardiopsis changdeensis TaxID=2831969 RepID=A0ABX8BJ67_9ACTN|nr:MULTISPECIES: hypothetical protein [Nocardiopsis]QUX20976.1 hypothetical protein KGD84_21285 [Nocardiopsis changdeensis]QYX36907.1 hypothetical protein K1J57_30740 [Nocardiopsis sp. MT53]